MDWIKIINELQASGLTQQAIADFCGCTQSTIAHIKRGTNKYPHAKTAFALMALHSAEMRKAARAA